MKSIVRDLRDLFPDTVVWEKTLETDRYGKITSKAAAKSLRCRVAGKRTDVKRPGGEVVISDVKCVIAGVYGVSVEDTFTLPSRFKPQAPPAIMVHQGTDENGAHHETVYF